MTIVAIVTSIRVNPDWLEQRIRDNGSAARRLGEMEFTMPLYRHYSSAIQRTGPPFLALPAVGLNGSMSDP